MTFESLADALNESGWSGGYATALLDDEYRTARREYGEFLVDSLRNVAAWLAVDSFFGGGDFSDASNHSHANPDRQRYQGFRACAAVSQMSAELGKAAAQLLDDDMSYAAAALVRQIVECEYLFAKFSDSFEAASAWTTASPSEIRAGFQPKQLRKVGGFSDLEYWNHCDIGGHPNPKGIYLLQLEGMMPRLAMKPEKDERKPRREMVKQEMWLDMVLHLQRVWMAQTRLLTREHARFADVRREVINAVDEQYEQWAEVDPVAHPQVLSALMTGVSGND